MTLLDFFMYWIASTLFVWCMLYVLYPELALEDENGCDALLPGTDHLFY
jgi:hypothetical protein